jgi:photosystem II stability/assembly factor-like uncharacterized protein
MHRHLIVAAALIVGCAPVASGPTFSTVSPSPSSSSSPVATPLPSLAPPTAIPYPSVSAISAPSANVLWVVTDDARLFRSADQGDNWEERTMLAHPPIGRGSVSFANDEEGWFLNGFVPGTQCQQQAFELWHTTDGAATWALVTRVSPGPGAIGISFGQCKGALSFADPLRGVLPAMDTTTPPTIYRTSDGGQSWTGQRIPDPPGFTTSGGGNALQPGRASWSGSTLLFDALTYVEGKPNRHVFRSNDSGKTWAQVRIVTDAMQPIVFVTPVRWLRFSRPSALETIDQGLTWHAYATDYQQGAAPVTPNVVFASPSMGYAAVRFSLQRSVDGGEHWTALRMPGH